MHIKDYIIFLKGCSDNIQGRVSDGMAIDLKNAFIKSRLDKSAKVFEFNDCEGLCAVDLSQVVAVCVNDVFEKNLGFNGEG